MFMVVNTLSRALTPETWEKNVQKHLVLHIFRAIMRINVRKQPVSHIFWRVKKGTGREECLGGWKEEGVKFPKP